MHAELQGFLILSSVWLHYLSIALCRGDIQLFEIPLRSVAVSEKHFMLGVMPRKVAAAAAGARKIAAAPKSRKLAEKFPPGTVLKDVGKKEWKLGSVIGQGGFGLIYLASEASSDKKTENYIIKIEPKDNGPLFCETHFYQRVAKLEYIEAFISEHRLRYLSIPPYISAGIQAYNSREYRFLVMPRLGKDLQKLLQECGGVFPPSTTYAVGLRMVDALQFLHEKEYVHADIKASNILLGYSKGHDVTNEVYLVDFGLAYRYTVGSEHKEYKEDPKRAHDGTIEFTSRDAHKGLAPSRRGDLEILGYCMLQWLCGRLPWEDKLGDPNYVAKSKESFMSNLSAQLPKCLPDSPLHSGCMQKYFQLVNKLQYHSKPNYDQIREIFRHGLAISGQKNEWIIEFTQKTKKRKHTDHSSLENTPPSGSVSPKKSPRMASPAVRQPACASLKLPLASGAVKSPAGNTKVVKTKTAAVRSKATPPASAKFATKRGLASATPPLRGKRVYGSLKPKKHFPMPAPTSSLTPAAASAKFATKRGLASATPPSRGKRVYGGLKPKKHFPMPAPTPSLTPAAAEKRKPPAKRRAKRVDAVKTDMSIQTSPGLQNNR